MKEYYKRNYSYGNKKHRHKEQMEKFKNSRKNFNYEDVKSKYEQTDYISLLETKFSINIFKLIENKSLVTFYDTFNKLNFDSNIFNIDLTII